MDEILFGDEGAEEAQGGQASEAHGDGDENRGSDSSDSGDQEAAAHDELTLSTLTPEVQAAVGRTRSWGKIVERLQAYREIFPSVEAARRSGADFSGCGCGAGGASSNVAELQQIDALFSANRPETHAELAAAIQRLNPEAFQSLARMMRAVADAGAARSGGRGSAKDEENGTARVSAAGRGVNADAVAGEAGAAGAESGPGVAEQGQREAEVRVAERAQAARAVNHDAQRAFFHEANAAAVEGRVGRDRTQVDRLLPDEISEGARKRVTGIFIGSWAGRWNRRRDFGIECGRCLEPGGWMGGRSMR